MAIDNDFLAFKFDGKSSQTYNLYVVSSGDRYQDNLVPDLTDLTEARVGADGTNYFGSNYTKRAKPVNVAFDNLSEVQLREMRSWLGTKKICPLIFSEAPYKQYYAKIQNPPQFKYLCFDNGEGQRVYKGEGTINFVYYYPFAKAVHKYLSEYDDENTPQWQNAAGFCYDNSHLTESTPARADLNFEHTGVAGATQINQITNTGDIPTDWKLTFSRKLYKEENLAPIKLYKNTENSVEQIASLILKPLPTANTSGSIAERVAATTSGEIEIDSKKQTITYIDTVGEIGASGDRFCLNDLYQSGEFFKVPMQKPIKTDDSELTPIINNEPYLFRKSGGNTNIGKSNGAIDKLVGGTIAWNQLIRDGNFDTDSHWDVNNSGYGEISVNNHICTATVGAEATNSLYLINKKIDTDADWSYTIGHIYLCSIYINPNKNTWARFLYSSITEKLQQRSLVANTWNHYTSVVKLTALPSTPTSFYFYFNIGGALSSGDTVQFKKAFVVDLTLAFGEAIAQHIYDLEYSENSDGYGVGVAWLKSYGFVCEDYYANNIGSLESVNTSAHIMKGFNLFNITTKTNNKILNWTTGALVTNNLSVASDYIRVVEGQTYYCNYKAQWMCYNFDKEYLGSLSANGELVPIGGTGGYPTNVAVPMGHNIYYIRLGFRSDQNNNINFTSRSNMMFNISQPNTAISPHNGDYVHYSENTYPLDNTLSLNGLYKLDADNNLYCDGDTYESDGTVTRKYGIVDLGTLIWNYRSDIKAGLFSANIPDYLYTENVGAICHKYGYEGTVSAAIYVNTDKTCAFYYYRDASPRSFYVYDTSYTDAASFKTAMSGVYLVYELTTATEESADAYQNPQIVDDFGTEEYVDAGVEAGTRDVAVPVGHETTYIDNIEEYFPFYTFSLPVIAAAASTFTCDFKFDILYY